MLGAALLCSRLPCRAAAGCCGLRAARRPPFGRTKLEIEASWGSSLPTVADFSGRSMH